MIMTNRLYDINAFWSHFLSSSFSTSLSVLTISDDRNPEFHPGGEALAAYNETVSSLKIPSLLKKCSWQRFMRRSRLENEFDWLTDPIEQKYGL